MAKTTKPSLADLVDELGAIQKELAPFEGKIKRAEGLRKAIRDEAPETSNQVEGKQFIAVLGPHALKTHVNYRELVKRIGAVAFAKFATATQQQLAENVPAGHLAHCISQDNSGPRSLKVIERGTAQ